MLILSLNIFYFQIGVDPNKVAVSDDTVLGEYRYAALFWAMFDKLILLFIYR